MKTLATRIKRRITRQLFYRIFQFPRILKYRLLSDMDIVKGAKPFVHHPVLFLGRGTVWIGKGVHFGVTPSPYFYSGYIHIEARNPESTIEIGDSIWFNNNCSLVSEGPGISIGQNSLFGSNVEIYDSDFHDLDPRKRMENGCPKKAHVHIGNNVFIGSNVKVLKGVAIGDNSVIGNGSIVLASIPANVVAAGNPARTMRELISSRPTGSGRIQGSGTA